MVDLIAEAFQVQQFFHQQNWRFCFIGGLAVQVWGEARLTRDTDLSLLTGFGNEEPYIRRLLARFEPRISGAGEFALQTRTLLLKCDTGVPLNISLAALPFEEAMISRAIDRELLPNQPLRICSAEDLIVSKLFAHRDTDLRDVRSVIVRTQPLDWTYIEQELGVLEQLLDASGLVEQARMLRGA